MIRVYDTMRRDLVPLDTREEGVVAMYVCGPTVQSEPHVGHGRSAVVFDVIRRYLTWRGYQVRYVRNITDVEDKIIAAAAETGETMEGLGRRMAVRFAESYHGLGVADPDVEPKATEHIPQIIELIARLIDRGLAYVRDGDVYFSVRATEGYGRLSGVRPDELRSGHRIEPEENKDDPLDFALWKAAKPSEPSWDSPWGPGRPGWHIECSAMAETYLGDGFDIHGGGTDLIFPHHENEIAQSEGASGRVFARIWLHNGMVNLGGEKMAKSTGRVVDLRAILDLYGGRPLRLLYLRAHYRSPIEYVPELLEEAAEALGRLDRFRERATPGEPDPAALDTFRAVMDDDFSTPEAVSLLFDLVRVGNRLADLGEDVSALTGAVEVIVDALGLDAAAPAPETLGELGDLGARFGVEGDGEEAIVALVELRERARAERRYDEADEIRTALAEAGIVLEDGADGTRWLRR
ncbi:MAG: cysteine--tRNA ligase [Actinobacteria bacterium]|nr:cysteine--tRNA ligase [Actinomycetota bacterium]MCI0544564.1 cysteine--tRNA ligase [Actinomycetota bacterium]